ncbi:MAG TPA: ferritin family protein [Roseiarcus sp.]|nr:ferritin family protein [Roseiarcus sp.]
MAQDKDAARCQADLQSEIDRASLYRALADAEADPQTSAIFRKLAAVEDAHAEFWRKNLNRIGALTAAVIFAMGALFGVALAG